MRFLCRIGWHEWGKWEQALFEVWTSYHGIPIESSRRQVLKQITNCIHCNKHKTRDI